MRGRDIVMINKKKLISIILIFLIHGTYPSDFKLGIENIPHNLIAQYTSSPGLRIGLVTNQTGKDQQGNCSIDVLLKKGFKVSFIFAPEHGLNGKEEAGKEIKDERNAKINIPVISLYAGGDKSKKIDPNLLKNLDALFVDIQDSGMRHYTYISTLFEVLKAAGNNGKKVVVFDRPNPLGRTMEGPLVDPGLISFISIAPIPLRHGMTMGELAEYFNNHILDNKAALTVVEMKNYDRSYGISHLPAPLSPNIASKASCLGYSFLGLVGEIKPFDVGVGTPHAFQLITLPESLSLHPSVWQKLAAKLKELGIATMPHRYMNERKKEYYHGLRLNIEDINQVNAFNAFLVTASIMKKAGVQIDFAVNFDKAAGSKQVRSFLLGDISYQELRNEINNGLHSFFQKAQAVFKYLPHPELRFN